MENTTTATLKQITNAQEGTNKAGNPWRKATVVVETIGSYPKTIAFTAFNSTLDSVTAFPLGTIVDVAFEVESREYNGKWYTDAILRSATPHAQTQPAPKPQRATQTRIDTFPPQPSPEQDDLPF